MTRPPRVRPTRRVFVLALTSYSLALACWSETEEKKSLRFAGARRTLVSTHATSHEGTVFEGLVLLLFTILGLPVIDEPTVVGHAPAALGRHARSNIHTAERDTFQASENCG